MSKKKFTLSWVDNLGARSWMLLFPQLMHKHIVGGRRFYKHNLYFHHTCEISETISSGFFLKVLECLTNKRSFQHPESSILFTEVITTVKFNVLNFRTLSCLPKRPRQTADPGQTASVRSGSSDKHFVNSSPYNQNFIWEQKEKSVWNFKTFTIHELLFAGIFPQSLFRQYSKTCR